MSEELNENYGGLTSLSDFYLTLSRIRGDSVQVAKDFAYGFYEAGIEIAAIPLASPTAIRKIRR